MTLHIKTVQAAARTQVHASVSVVVLMIQSPMKEIRIWVHFMYSTDHHFTAEQRNIILSALPASMQSYRQLQTQAVKVIWTLFILGAKEQ